MPRRPRDWGLVAQAVATLAYLALWPVGFWILTGMYDGRYTWRGLFEDALVFAVLAGIARLGFVLAARWPPPPR